VDPPPVEDAPAARRQVRTGLTAADLLALAVPFASSFAAEIAPVLADAHLASGGEVFVHDVHGHVVSIPMTLAWLCLPLGALVHHVRTRARAAALPPSMPVARVGWALALVAVVLVFGALGSGNATAGAPRRYSDYLPDIDGSGGPLWLAHDRMMVTLGLAVAVFGARSRRGAHRRLFGAAMQRRLAAVTGALALVAASSGAYGAVAAPPTAADPHQPLVSARALLLQLPLILAAALAAAAAVRRSHRDAAFALGAGASLTLAVTTIAAPFEGPVGTLTAAALMATSAVGLIAAAGAAEPVPRDRA